ncbi:MAG: recombinase, partial [Deltaproteobacteria bacterium]|nr:recombinase [Deltaproteobacteria bacterium]
MSPDKIELVSIGIDIGSSTSHLVLSKLLLRKEEKSASRRFVIKQRNIIYQGRIINTPLLDDDTIDIDKLTGFIKEECDVAGVKVEDIQTGAVVITGESANKINAREIVDAISNDAGKFVSATAGPNFESLIAALGSGATA